MTRYDYYNVKLPEGDSPFETREQVWAAFASLTSGFSRLLDRAGIKWRKPENGSPLGTLEAAALSREANRLQGVVRSLGENVVDGIAALKPPSNIEYSPEVDAAMGNFDGDIHDFVWNKPNHELVALAIAVLDKAGYESDTKSILALIAKSDEDQHYYDRRKKQPVDERKVHECPRCETDGELRRGERRERCTRCYGRGYVFQTGRPSDSEYEMTSEGKLALNAGQPWTEADEARVRREVYGYDDEEEEEEAA